MTAPNKTDNLFLQTLIECQFALSIIAAVLDHDTQLSSLGLRSHTKKLGAIERTSRDFSRPFITSFLESLKGHRKLSWTDGQRVILDELIRKTEIALRAHKNRKVWLGLRRIAAGHILKAARDFVGSEVLTNFENNKVANYSKGRRAAVDKSNREWSYK